MWSVIKVFKQSALNEPKNKTLTQRAAQKQPTKRTTTGTPVTNFWCFDRGHKMPFRDCFATSLLSKRLRSSWSFLPWGWRRRNESSFFCGGSQRDKYGQLFSDQAVFRCGEVWALVPFCNIHRTIHWFAGVFVCHIGVLRASLQVCLFAPEAAIDWSWKRRQVMHVHPKNSNEIHSSLTVVLFIHKVRYRRYMM